MGWATWELIYTDRWIDRQTDRQTRLNYSPSLKGLSIWQTVSQHVVSICCAGLSGGPQTVFPRKSSWQAAIMLLIWGMSQNILLMCLFCIPSSHTLVIVTSRIHWFFCCRKTLSLFERDFLINQVLHSQKSRFMGMAQNRRYLLQMSKWGDVQ